MKKKNEKERRCGVDSNSPRSSLEMRRSRLSAGGKRKKIIRSEGQRMLHVSLCKVNKIRGTLYYPIKSILIL